MSLPQSLRGPTCADLVERWQIDPRLAVKLLHLQMLWDQKFPRVGSLKIISGYRTEEHQAELAAQGRPTAVDSRSTHRTCPATGADLSLPIVADSYSKLALGELVILVGLRWGGGSRVLADGTPKDWNHVDLGPRTA